jgi:hypothetical protein
MEEFPASCGPLKDENHGVYSPALQLCTVSEVACRNRTGIYFQIGNLQEEKIISEMSAGRLAGLSVCLLTFLLLLALCSGARVAVLWVGLILVGLVAGAGLTLVLLAGLVMVRLPARQQPSLGEVSDLQPHRNSHLQL